jgi:hypothetical protein
MHLSTEEAMFRHAELGKDELRQSFSMCVYCMLCVFKLISLVGYNQRNFFENTTACSKRILKNNCRNSDLNHTTIVYYDSLLMPLLRRQ